MVEALSDNYNVALLNSKNAWRILGQESYAYEIAQDFEYGMENKAVVLPIGNAGNITAVLSGFLKFLDTGIINALPKIIGVQSEHANPVYAYYLQPDAGKRKFVPMTVKPSVAQAAMIGNPVSMPRVVQLVEYYNHVAGQQRIFVVEVTEQAIMDWELIANRNGHIACTHGGESLAGLVLANHRGIVEPDDIGIVDSTAHGLKFSEFQAMYFENTFRPAYGIHPDPDLVNAPALVHPKALDRVPAPGRPLEGDDLEAFVQSVSEDIAEALHLEKANGQ